MNRIDKIIMNAIGNSSNYKEKNSKAATSYNNRSSVLSLTDEVNSCVGNDNAKICTKVDDITVLQISDAIIEDNESVCPIQPAMSNAIPKAIPESNNDILCDDAFLKDNEALLPITADNDHNVRNTNAITEDYDVLYNESPVAPIYSPLTPLVNKKILSETVPESGKEASSPLRPMTPETFNLLQTLSEDMSTSPRIDIDIDYYPKDIIDSNYKYKKANNKTESEQETDFSSDTDEDYIPNSESDSNSGHKNIIPKRLLVQVRAEVHDNNQNKENSAIATNAVTVNAANEINNNSHIEEIEELSDANNSQSSRPQKGRKRRNKEHTIAQRKKRKYANLPYYNNKNLVDSKNFCDHTCHCKKQCHNLVEKEKRQEEFQKYVTLGSYEAQLLYIVNCVSETPKKRSYCSNNKKSNKTKPKQFSRIYKINNVQVCREMFTKTFQISTKKIDESLRKFRKGFIKDGRGNAGGRNKTPQEEIDLIKQIIDSLPKYNSHYRRDQNNGCQYLKLGMTVLKIYELYVEQHKKIYGDTKNPMSIGIVKNVFYTSYNLRCKSLKKDTCNRCDTLHIKITGATEPDEVDKLKREKQEHLERAETLRKLMNEDLKRATTDEKFECLTYDMEKTLPLPRIPTSIVFYKRQLWLYNCGIHAGSTDIGFCNVWLEGEAGRGAQEVGSCLIHYIKNIMSPKEHLVLWSDCCGGQNRNIKMVLMMKFVLNSHATLKTIQLKYLESGHTFLPNDTDFSKIESELKYHDRIYTAEGYINVIKGCKKKKPLQVYKMKTEDFVGTKKMEKKIVNRKIFVTKSKVNWLKTKEILIEKEKPFSIFMKTTENEEYQELNLQKKMKGKSFEIFDEDLELLWPNRKEIPQAKLDDLESMYDLIPKDCLTFYKSLKGNANLTEDIDGFGEVVDFPLDNLEDD